MRTRAFTIIAGILILFACIAAAGCTAEEKQPIIDEKPYMVIDTDPGIDDAIALLLSEVLTGEPDMLIGTAGNVPIELVYNNTLLLHDYLNSDSEIFFGASTRLNGDRIYYDEYFGEDGMGDLSYLFEEFTQKKHNISPYDLKNYLDEQYYQYDNIEAIGNELMQHEHITYVLLSPSTTLASLIQRYPSLVNKIDNVYIMGGGFNITNAPHDAEFNMAGDPLADQIVFDSGLTITLLPLDMTMSYVINKEEIEAIIDSGKYPEMANMMVYGREMSIKRNQSNGFELNDPIAMMCALYPQDFTVRDTKISIDDYGATKDLGPDAKDGYPVRIGTSINSSTLYNGFVKAFGG